MLCVAKPKPHLPYIRMYCFLFTNNLRVCDFLMNVFRYNKIDEFREIYIVWNEESWLSCIYGNTLFQLLIDIYCKKKKTYGMYSQKLVVFLEIFARISCIPIIWSSLI
jgi:hypothetical protein